MPNKQRTTFQKRQKEIARQEKQRRKTERRVERRLQKADRAMHPEQAEELSPALAAAGEDSPPSNSAA